MTADEGTGAPAERESVTKAGPQTDAVAVRLIGRQFCQRGWDTGCYADDRVTRD